MIKQIIFWLNNSRLFSLPMTFMSWLVVFLYSLKFGGNITNGILALIGIIFAHLATNLFDDYVDYKKLSNDKAFLENPIKSKCVYLKRGEATLSELLRVVVIYCSIAFFFGVILFFRCGYPVIFLALVGGALTLFYSKLSSNGFSELAVGIAFGPLLFEGVYYVMCNNFSLNIFILSIAIVIFTVGLVYMNKLLDYDCDILTGSKSLCCRLGKQKAAFVLFLIYCFGYLMCVLLSVRSCNWLYILPLITFPYALFIYKSVLKFYENPELVPKVKWWNYPLDNWDKLKASNTASFYFRLFLARNIMMWVCILVIIAILLPYIWY